MQFRQCFFVLVFKASLESKESAVGIHHADHMAPSNVQKLSLTSPTGGGRSVIIIRSQAQATEFSGFFLCFYSSF
jgi:hypothetical protein